MSYPGPFDCFMIERAPLKRVWLRRYLGGSSLEGCKGPMGYHNAMTLVGDVPSPVPASPYESIDEADSRFDHDARWPTHCAGCGEPFKASDTRQVFSLRLWSAPGREGLWHIHDGGLEGRAPDGAMYYEDWHCDAHGAPWWPGPDGKTLAVMTPAGAWTIDGPDKDGKRCWTRTGTPPNVTVTPSIRFGGFDNVPERYHGWVTAGRLLPC